MIPITRPLMDEREERAVSAVIQSGWITQGPEVARFEKAFTETVHAAHACAVSSCTAALHLALLAAGVKPGDQVIAPSHSFIATANAIRFCGAIPVFVDIDRDTYNLDPEKVAASITPQTRAILAVHQMGMPCDMKRIGRIAKEHGLAVVEDAACAIGSQILGDGGWEPIGLPHGDIACFSFHPRKVITTGEGGMLTTSLAAHDRAFRLGRQHSMSVPDTVRHGAREVVFETYLEQGFNYRMTDLAAAVGLVQLTRLQAIVEERRKLASAYCGLFDGTAIGVPKEPEWAQSNWQSYCVRLPREVEQKRVMQYMLDKGIATRRGIMCSHREAAWPTGEWVMGAGGLGESEAAQGECILLPLFPGLCSADQVRVAQTLIEAIGR